MEERKLSQRNFHRQENRFQHLKEKSFEGLKLLKKNFLRIEMNEENELLSRKVENGQEFKYLKRFYEETSLLKIFSQNDFLFEM